MAVVQSTTETKGCQDSEPKIEDSACAIYNFCAEFLRILCKFCALIRKEEIQTYKCFALTLNDIRINYKIRTNNEKCRHLLDRPGT